MLRETNIPIIQDSVDTIVKLNKDQKFREYIREREKWEMDYYAGLASAEKRGEKRGRSEGINIGRKEGINIGKKEGINIGRKEGINMGIERGLILGTIKTAFSFGQSEEQVLKLLVESNNLSIADAKMYIEEYYKTKN